jgi:2-hydroxychromene-2-carboxylate isomerase
LSTRNRRRLEQPLWLLGSKGRGWSFIELFFRNQGTEASGYVTDEFLTEIAEAAGVPDIGEWNEARGSPEVTHEVEATTHEANKFGLIGAPSFAVEGPGTNGMELLGTPQSASEFEQAITRASAR